MSNNLNTSVENERLSIEKDNERFSDELESDNQDKTPNNVQDFHEAIKNTIERFGQVEKSKAMAAIKEAGLPKAYQKIDSLDELKNYYDILKNIK